MCAKKCAKLFRCTPLSLFANRQKEKLEFYDRLQFIFRHILPGVAVFNDGISGVVGLSIGETEGLFKKRGGKKRVKWSSISIRQHFFALNEFGVALLLLLK